MWLDVVVEKHLWISSGTRRSKLMLTPAVGNETYVSSGCCRPISVLIFDANLTFGDLTTLSALCGSPIQRSGVQVLAADSLENENSSGVKSPFTSQSSDFHRKLE